MDSRCVSECFGGERSWEGRRHASAVKLASHLGSLASHISYREGRNDSVSPITTVQERTEVGYLIEGGGKNGTLPPFQKGRMSL